MEQPQNVYQEVNESKLNKYNHRIVGKLEFQNGTKVKFSGRITVSAATYKESVELIKTQGSTFMAQAVNSGILYVELDLG